MTNEIQGNKRKAGVRDPKTFTYERTGTTTWLCNGEYWIDHEFFGGCGKCACKNFEFEHEPVIEAARAAGDSKLFSRCKHLVEMFRRIENGKLHLKEPEIQGAVG